MKIDYLHIRSPFKNLEGVCVDFDERNLMTVIVGRNGSGKSNVLEALVSIFRSMDLGEAPAFSYLIRYCLGAGNEKRWITVEASPSDLAAAKQYKVSEESKDGKRVVPFAKVKRDKAGKSAYLPRYLFAYYSGPSDRLEAYFKYHRGDFYRKLLEDRVNLSGDIRPLFYAKPSHSQFVLLAFFLSNQSAKERAFLREQLGIIELDAVHFVMRKPDWAKSSARKERFWGAGGVVRQFLDRLYPLALAPLRIRRNEDLSLTGRRVKNEFVHLFLQNVDALRDFAQGLSPDVFFKMLESTLLSEIISEVSVRVRVESSEDSLTFRELSEGEQQLLTVLGLLKFTGGQDSLFLLDEPDTHLNPAWAANYLRFLEDFVPSREASHLMMVTHHPLAIAALEKEQVQVMERTVGSGRAYAKEPEESPRGLGYAGILTSEMFGLRTTLDAPTEELVRKRRELASKTTLTQADQLSLKEIDKELAGLGFSTAHWDSDYVEYLKERRRLEDALPSDRPHEGALAERRRVAKQVLAKILEAERREQ